MDKIIKKENAMDIINRIKGDKKKLVALLLLAVGLLLILFSPSSRSEKEENGNASSSLSEYKRELEEDLSELCSSIEGAGKCRVSVSFSEGAKAEYRGTNKISETPPKVLGITVIAEGGDRADVKTALTECMTSMFDIKRNRVAVLKMR